jgi:hypothetical protein
VKLLRGRLEIEEHKKLKWRDESRQRYHGDKYFYQALRPNVAAPDPAKPGDFTDPKSGVEFFAKGKKFPHHTWIKVFIPSQDAVWVFRTLHENYNPRNVNGIIEISNNIVVAGWENFPLKAGENEVGEPVLATQILDPTKKDNPLVLKWALDDKARRWWQVRYPVLSKQGRAELKTGWVCEKDFEKANNGQQ